MDGPLEYVNLCIVYVAENGLSCRFIICIMVILGYFHDGFVRIDINIAIIDMIQPENNASIIHFKGQETRFKITKAQRENLMFANFYGAIISQPFAGYMVDSLGPRRIMGYSLLLAGILTGFFPLIGVTLGYHGLLWGRILSGVLTGGLCPCLMPIAYRWFAQDQWAKSMALLSTGTIGVAIGMPIFGVLISNYGWGSVFYFTAVSSVLFSLFWFYLIFDSPNDHPRISMKEKLAILNQLKTNTPKTKSRKIPLLKMITSTEIWASFITNSCGMIVFLFLLTETPSFLNSVHKVDVKQNGLLNSLPFLLHFFAAVAFATAGDKMVQSKKMRVLKIRKIFVTISSFIASLFLILQGFIGMYLIAAVTIYCIWLCLGSSVIAGSMANNLDVAPNFCGFLFALQSTFASIVIIFLSQLLSYFQSIGSDFDAFRKLFFILAGINIFSWGVFMVFASDKPPKWACLGDKTELESKEQEKMISITK